MSEDKFVKIKPIAAVRSRFPEKFGIPRQSGIIEEIISKVIFYPEYRDEAAFRSLEEFSHIWLIWHFSENEGKKWSPTVRPPRLGGNKRVGVFATRSPFRPNLIGLSLVKLEKIEYDKKDGPVLCISGADIVDNTPVFDIKPYIPYTDSRPDAVGGFSDRVKDYSLNVNIPEEFLSLLPEELHDIFFKVLSQDPRPSYHNDPERVYSFDMYGYKISFSVKDKVLTVKNIKSN